MKKVISLIYLLGVFQSLTAQNKTEIKQKLDSLANVYKEYRLNNQLQKKRFEATITSEKWDSINFDPYRNDIKIQPFEITFSDSTYTSPIDGKKVITSRYGWRRGRAHQGIDIDLVTGDSVRTMFDGIVRFARYSSGHGRIVIVRHYNGLETGYAHLSEYQVKANDTVSAGDIIGIGGKSGNARGSHLHLITSYKGNYINPEYLFDFSESNAVRNENLWVTKKWVTAQYHGSKRQTELELLTTKSLAEASHKEDNRKKIHVVRSGETLSGISDKYRISVSRLCKTNSIRKTSLLRIGQKLVVSL
ncbi:Murein DD-endopeptidase MepM and murein hydrolase activator NlpD, contain LysM domain [Algibacter lectus]|uniref:peptidoglycan DD-metalloendopeptidase family protein n=1 Tax=Algibacter lectus TaxID=221126 RepID=UPI0008EF56F9|nr:peptidoglycan DD-metalloendopeptidase family protein [Algibacter lectus]SFC32341.1 Murein DD-endopeptidase MepM and murein hydrolase activator NlpD, contain LysM domain [Algibacter lectus]